MYLFILFLSIPLIEIFLFATLGSLIGPWLTVGLVILTAAIGVSLLRQQGLATMARAQDKMRHGELPDTELMEGLMLAVGGALLLTPGFFTDAIGFSLLIPPSRAVIRKLLVRLMKNKVQVHTFGDQQSPGSGVHGHFGRTDFDPTPKGEASRKPKEGHTLEGEFRRD